MEKLASVKNADFTLTPHRALADSFLDNGRIDDARLEIKTALAALASTDIDEILACRNLLCKIERAGRNLNEALRIHLESYPLVDLCSYPILKARFHNGLGITYRNLGLDKPEYLDRALIAFEAFKFHAEEAGDEKEVGRAVNNIALVLCQIGRTSEAHSELERARGFFTDPTRLAEIDDTEAQVFLKEDKPVDALPLSLNACQTLYRAGETKLLKEALSTLIKASADCRMLGS